MSDTGIEDRRLDEGSVAWMKRMSSIGAGCALFVGLVLMAGWMFGSDLMKAFLPGHITAKPNAALGIMVAATAVLLQASEAQWAQPVARALTWLVGSLGAGTCLEWVSGRDFGIDQLLFPEAQGAVETTVPGRMALITSLELILLAWVMLDERRRRASSLATVGVSVSAIALLGYSFGADALYAFGSGTRISLPVALSMCLLFSSVLLRGEPCGWMAAMASRYAGGAMLRRAVPFAIAAPWLLSWLALAGSRTGAYSYNTDQVVTAAPLILLSLLLLFQWAHTMDSLDQKREERREEAESRSRELEWRVQERTAALLAANEASRLSELRYRSLVEATAQIVWTTDANGQVLWDMPSWRAFTGQSFDEMKGAGWLDSLHPEDRARTEAGWRAAVESRSFYEAEYRIRRRDGEYRHVWVRGVPVMVEECGIREWVGTCTDITDRKLNEQAVAAERQRLRDVLDQLPAYTILLTSDYHVAFANRVFRERFGESGGRHCYEFLFKRQTPCEICETYKVLATNVPVAWKWTGPDGRHYDIYDFPFTDLDGTRLILEMGIDVTDRESAQQELRRVNRALRALNHCTEALVRATDEVSLLQQVCDIIVQVGGYPLCWAGYAEDDAQKTVKAVAVSGLGVDYVRNARITWADTERGRGPTGTAIRTGQPCYIGDVAADPRFTPWVKNAVQHGYASVLAVPLSDGKRCFGALNVYAPEPHAFDAEEQSLLVELASNLSHGILAFRIRAERDRIEIELRRLNESLEWRVADRTAELAVAVQELESFTYSVSHDLRAPLRHIDGFSKMLLEHASNSLDEESRHYLERVRHATQRMGNLIDDLLKLSRLGRRELRREIVDMTALVTEVVSEIAPDVKERAMEWRIGRLPPASGDAGLLRQVWFNLLANAAKFTRGRTPAVIEVGAEGTEYFVRDNGVGFDPRYADKLFGAFQRLHRTEDFEGTGVGLATVRRIVRRHGGDVRAISTPECGATFYFNISARESGIEALEVQHAAD